MSAQTIVSAILPIIGFVNGAVMILSPQKAAKKIYKFDEKECKPSVIDLVQANGGPALSLALAELLSFANVDSNTASGIATLTRISFLFYSMSNKTSLGKECMSQRNLVKVVFTTILLEGRWMEQTLSMQVRGGFYFLLGLLFIVAPGYVAKRTNEFDANPTVERCLKARGKMDILFGTFIFCLATMPYLQAQGYACLVWFISSLYGDFLAVPRDQFRSDAFTQLLIASVSTCVLLIGA